MDPSEINEKPRFSWKRLLITVGIVTITAGVTGGSIYYAMNQTDVTKCQNTLSVTNGSKKTEAITATRATPTTTIATTPVIAWKTGVDINAQEKSSITKKIIEPYLDFEKEQKRTIVSVIVEEIPDGNKKAGEPYYYIDVVRDDGYGGGWAFGESGNIDYWKAICGLGQCASDAFKAKYPNNWQ